MYDSLTAKPILMKVANLLTFCFVALCCNLAAQSNFKIWQEAYDAAFAKAVEEEKLVLFIITGKAWDDTSKTLVNEVIGRSIIEESYAEDLIVLHLDLRENDLFHQMQSYDSLLYAYGPEILPKTMLCDRQGRPYVVIEGKQHGTAGEYIKEIDSMLEAFAVQKKAEDDASGLEGQAKLQALAAALGNLKAQPIILTRFHSRNMLEINSLIGHNEGFIRTYLMTAKIRDFVAELSRNNHYDNIDKIDKKLSDLDLTLYDKQRLLIYKAIAIVNAVEPIFPRAEDPVQECIVESEALDPANLYVARELTVLGKQLSSLIGEYRKRERTLEIEEERREEEIDRKHRRIREKITKFKLPTIDDSPPDAWRYKNSANAANRVLKSHSESIERWTILDFQALSSLISDLDEEFGDYFSFPAENPYFSWKLTEDGFTVTYYFPVAYQKEFDAIYKEIKNRRAFRIEQEAIFHDELMEYYD